MEKKTKRALIAGGIVAGAASVFLAWYLFKKVDEMFSDLDFSSDWDLVNDEPSQQRKD